MTNTTESVLYSISDKLNEIRRMMDNYMYGNESPLPEEDLAYCRKVYDSICKTLDLL